MSFPFQANREIRLAIVTNIPVPYRIPVYDRLAQSAGVVLHVFYAKEREPDRQWKLPQIGHEHSFLKGRMHERHGRFIHDNPDVFDKLRTFSPDVVVTTGYNPTHLYAIGYALWYGRRHVAMTDGTIQSEAGLSRLHRALRRFVLARSWSYVAASNGGMRLFNQYGIRESKVFFSPLCANTSVNWVSVTPISPGFDLLFSGRLVKVKNAGFFLNVARLVAQRLGRRVRVAILGTGPEEAVLRDKAAAMRDDVDAFFAGFVSQEQIPRWFQASRMFLFPTLWDPWGIVANEACQAGLPVLVSPFAGVAGELVHDGVNGYVLPLDPGLWADAGARLIQDDALHATMAAEAKRLVAPYNFENAARGIHDAARQAMMPRVLCVQRRLTHYRLRFFDHVRKQLKCDGVAFELVYGQPNKAESSREDSGSLPWAEYVPCKYWLRGQLCWQNPGRLARQADMIVLAQENKLIFNLVAMTLMRPRLLAYWGHGRNFQALDVNGWPERLKRIFVKRVDWWFAYTDLSSRFLQQAGFPASRITNLCNAVDDGELADECESISDSEKTAFRARFKIGGGPVGLFLGSLHNDKRLDFLLKSGARLAASFPMFQLLIVGAGPRRKMIEAAAEKYEWLRYCGALHGHEKALSLSVADVMLNPGMVGLGILDAFAAGLPTITTDFGRHSPEIDYLRDGENGIIAGNTVQAFTEAVARLLADEALRKRIGNGAKSHARQFTAMKMAQNFRDGVIAALKSA